MSSSALSSGSNLVGIVIISQPPIRRACYTALEASVLRATDFSVVEHGVNFDAVRALCGMAPQPWHPEREGHEADAADCILKRLDVVCFVKPIMVRWVSVHPKLARLVPVSKRSRCHGQAGGSFPDGEKLGSDFAYRASYFAEALENLINWPSRHYFKAHRENVINFSATFTSRPRHNKGWCQTTLVVQTGSSQVPCAPGWRAAQPAHRRNEGRKL